MTDQASDRAHTNRLIHETSPYLLQHARNPVDWYPWGPDALARAKEDDRLILLSIGYSACHWVMSWSASRLKMKRLRPS